MNASFRPKVGDVLVMEVAHRLTERDRSILTMLYRHRVFTTDQLAEMYFDNLNTAQHRLTTLHKLRLGFCFGHPCREAGARRVLAQGSVPVATAALGPTQWPNEAIWAPIGYDGLRLRLAELAAVPILAESEERIAKTQAYRQRPKSSGCG